MVYVLVADNKVANVIVYNGKDEYEPPEGHTLLEVSDDDNPHIGDSVISGKIVKSTI